MFHPSSSSVPTASVALQIKAGMWWSLTLSPDFQFFLSARGRFLPPHPFEIRCGKFRVSRRDTARFGVEELGVVLHSSLSGSACHVTTMLQRVAFLSARDLERGPRAPNNLYGQSLFPKREVNPVYSAAVGHSIALFKKNRM